jgi:hypothetical protein
MQLSLIQLVTSNVFNWAIWVYSVIQLFQASGNWIPASVTTIHPARNAEIALILILLGLCIGWLYLTSKLYYVFGWTTYKEMGADVEVRSKFFFIIFLNWTNLTL